MKENYLQRYGIKLSKMEKGIEIFNIVIMIISFIIIILALFSPCIQFDSNELIITNKDTKFYEIAEEISENENLYNKFSENMESDLRYCESGVGLGTVILQIIADNTDEANEEGCFNISYVKFTYYTVKYTFFSGSGNRVLLSDVLTSLGTIFFVVMAFILLAIALICIAMAISNIVALIRNPAKISSGFYGGLPIFLYILLIPFLLATIPAVFAWHPVYSWYLLFFKLSPLSYFILAAVGMLFILGIIVKIIKRIAVKFRYSY